MSGTCIFCGYTNQKLSTLNETNFARIFGFLYLMKKFHMMAKFSLNKSYTTHLGEVFWLNKDFLKLSV